MLYACSNFSKSLLCFCPLKVKLIKLLPFYGAIRLLVQLYNPPTWVFLLHVCPLIPHIVMMFLVVPFWSMKIPTIYLLAPVIIQQKV